MDKNQFNTMWNSLVDRQTEPFVIQYLQKFGLTMDNLRNMPAAQALAELKDAVNFATSLIGNERQHTDEEYSENDIPKYSKRSVEYAPDHFILNKTSSLTPKYLHDMVTPLLLEITEMQEIIDGILGREEGLVTIRSISQNSPIDISLAGAPETVKFITENAVEWRRDHAKEMARQEEVKARLENEQKKAEIIDQHVEAQKHRAELEKLKLENEKLRLENEKTKIDLIIRFLNEIAPNLPEDIRVIYVHQLLPSVSFIVDNCNLT